jgi:hypothetical protein
VVALVAATGGLDEVPSEMEYEVAPATAFQERLCVTGTPVTPFAGELSTGAAGAGAWVVKVKVDDVVLPAEFVAATRQ